MQLVKIIKIAIKKKNLFKKVRWLDHMKKNILPVYFILSI